VNVHRVGHEGPGRKVSGLAILKEKKNQTYMARSKSEKMA
jgi:hypothetical protein